MVIIFCCVCEQEKDIDMNMFWQKSTQRNRFQEVRCVFCKNSNRLGKWLRRRQETNNSIEEWLRHNNALAKNKDRPAYMTVDLYRMQNINEERASKRNADNDVATKTTKRRRKE